MREPLEMYTASRMQHIVHIRKKNIFFFATSKCLFFLFFFTFRALSVESPRVGAINEHLLNVKNKNENGERHPTLVYDNLTLVNI